MPRERRAAVAGIAAGIVVIGALAVIFAFGQLHYPEFPSLAEQPDPRIPGTVEFVRWDRDGGCRYEVPAGGGTADLLGCGPGIHDGRRPLVPGERDGRRLETNSYDGDARVLVREPDGAETVLLEVEGPRDYAFWQAQWSPDGQWVLVADSAERLLVLPATGGQPRLLVEDAGDPRWRR